MSGNGVVSIVANGAWRVLAALHGPAAAVPEDASPTAAAGRAGSPDASHGAAAPARAPGPGAGEVFRDCPHCPGMVVVPSGSFTMGSPPSEEGRRDNEGPRHRVTIGSPFAVGVYEVTFAEWDACVSAGVATARTMRVGAAGGVPGTLRAANRSGLDAWYPHNNFGFRVARTFAP